MANSSTPHDTGHDAHPELIPYIVKSRPDTGLYNGKLGIWLFLASEVMLFGGLFSAYIFLRMGAEHWPYQSILNEKLGLLNTAVLICSSITMVLAWASLKLRDLKMYYVWMWVTIGCAAFFLGVKAVEYTSKWNHYGVFIKKESFSKYKAALEHENAKIVEHVTTDSFEVTGHLHGEHNAKKIKQQGFLEIVPDQKKGGASHSHASTTETVQGGSGAGGHGTAVKIESADILRWGNFIPKYSTFFAIYYTMTGLHALHIIGGMAVLAYLGSWGAAIYKENPEWLANRVETTGLFWHFVDLVWIFLFPVLYLL